MPSTLILWTAPPVALCLGLVAGAMLVRARTSIAQTTLRSAWGWAALALISCGAASLMHVLLGNASHLVGQAWYWSSVLLVCPFICVLGSRRPTNRVWNWFIMLPLVCVLGWPAVTVLARSPNLHPLDIQPPVVWGFCLTLGMGVGNYMGTRFAAAALLAGFASLAALIPLTTICPVWWPDLDWQLPTICA